MMQKETIVENENYSLWFYPKYKIIYHKFHQFIYGEALRECLNRGTEILEENKAKKWLSDDRNNAALSKEDGDWGQEIWLPRTIEAGWKFWAVMMPEKATGRMSMKRIIEQMADLGLTIEVFDDIDEALNWLKEQ